MSTAIPERRLRIFTLADHEPRVIAAVLAGNSKSNDTNLAAMTVGLGCVASGMMIHSAGFHEYLERMFGHCLGWLMALGEKNPFDKIHAERERQEKLFRDGINTFNVASPTPDVKRKLRVLTEEVGEVAKAIDKLERINCMTNHRNLREELVQVAAVCVAWLESMEGK